MVTYGVDGRRSLIDRRLGSLMLLLQIHEMLLLLLLILLLLLGKALLGGSIGVQIQVGVVVDFVA